MSVAFSITGRYIYSDEYLAFDFDFFNEDRDNLGGSSIYELVCIVKELDSSQNEVFSYLWKTCSIDTTSYYKKVILTPNSDIKYLSQSYILEIHNVRMPSTEKYNASIYLKNANDEIIIK